MFNNSNFKHSILRLINIVPFKWLILLINLQATYCGECPANNALLNILEAAMESSIIINVRQSNYETRHI